MVCMGSTSLMAYANRASTVGRAHGQAPRPGPRASVLQCGELAKNLQAPRRSPHERGKIPAAVAVTAVTADTAIVAADDDVRTST